MDTPKSRIVLTRRPSFVANKDKIICGYTLDAVGVTAPAVVAAKQPNGALIVTFYGRVGAYMPPKYAAHFGDVKFVLLHDLLCFGSLGTAEVKCILTIFVEVEFMCR